MRPPKPLNSLTLTGFFGVKIWLIEMRLLWMMNSYCAGVVAIYAQNQCFDVLTADNGAAAYVPRGQHTPDIIVTDIRCPP
jgi:hypothetical protein